MTRPGVLVRIDSRLLALEASQPVPVNEADRPSDAFAPIRCDGCGQVNVIWAPVEYRCYDDEYVGRFELWYESRHRRECAGCGASLDAELGYTWRKRNFPVISDPFDFCLNKHWLKGGRLVSAAGIEIPEAELRRAAERARPPEPSG